MMKMIFLNEHLLVGILSRLPTPDLWRCRCVSKQWHRRLVPSILAQRPNLPLSENTLMDVLSRLPPADLCRCKCVCKDWRRRLIPLATSLRPNITFVNFVKSPSFISFSDGSDGTVVHSDRSLPSPSLCSTIFEDDVAATRFLGVCNGMAFACTGLEYPREQGSWYLPNHPFCHVFGVGRYVLLNPVTGRVSTIRPPPETTANSFNFLAFDPRSSSKHYKIISLKLSDRARRETPYLYTSLTRKWRPLDFYEEKSAPHRMDPHLQQSCCLEGVAYRFAGDSDAPPPGYAQKNIMALDVKEERLFWISSPMVPDEDSRGKGHHSLGESAGYFRYAFHITGKSLSTWLLNGEWTYVHKINLEDAQQPLLRSFFFFAFHPLDANLIFVTYSDSLFVANLDNLELRQLADKDEGLRLGILCPYVCPW